ncbi:hypothetical protein LTR84_004935 [Exophiala bonariae]|uniref:Apple domain-containing protein n=1 Tax=Exophiala bonariae TaxID=1690606 RepID=A0AAV9NNS3_9EURO|nr:hypothetical protein LTR84_004935 [Exophiala bonariae]
MMVKSTSALLATTLMASSAMASTDAPWLDWTSSTTTTTTTTKKVDPATSTTYDPWLDWTSSTTTTTKKVVASTSSTYDPWLDWTSSTTTTKKVDPATSTSYVWGDWTSTSTKPVAVVTTTTTKPVSPATTSSAVWGDWDEVDPAAATCKAVTVTYTGVGFWVPDPAGAWADWTSSTTKPVAPATTTSTWVDPTWSDWVASTTTTTKKVSVSTTTTTAWVDPTWSDWVSSSTTLVTTTKGSWGSSSTGAATTKASTTTAAPKPAATCPSDNGKKVLAGGSCGCEYTVNCGVKASPDAKSVFWEKVSGGIVPTLGECLALCDANDKCEATLWVDDASNGDYHHCWQISGLGAPTGTGVAQISYKGTCSGKCSESYSKA